MAAELVPVGYELSHASGNGRAAPGLGQPACRDALPAPLERRRARASGSRSLCWLRAALALATLRVACCADGRPSIEEQLALGRPLIMNAGGRVLAVRLPSGAVRGGDFCGSGACYLPCTTQISGALADSIRAVGGTVGASGEPFAPSRDCNRKWRQELVAPGRPPLAAESRDVPSLPASRAVHAVPRSLWRFAAVSADGLFELLDEGLGPARGYPLTGDGEHGLPVGLLTASPGNVRRR